MADVENNLDNTAEDSQPVFRYSSEPEIVEQAPIVENEIITNDIVENQDSNLENEVADEYETVELTEDLALQHLASSKGMSVDEFKDSLTPKEQKKYAPEMEAFDKYIRETGNKNYNDFLETQKDWTTETPETTLREFIRLSNPDLSKKEQDFIYNEKYNIQDLDEEDDENLILKKGIDAKTDLRKANEFFSKRKEEFSVVRGTDEHIPTEYRDAKKYIENLTKEEQEYNKLLEEVRQDNILKASQIFNNSSEGFGYDIVNEDKSVDRLVYKPENMEEAKAWHSDLKNLNNLFFDESGKIKNVKDFYAVSEIARIGVQKYTEQIARTAQANLVERQDKISKNIQVDNVSNPVNTTSGIKFYVE